MDSACPGAFAAFLDSFLCPFPALPMMRSGISLRAPFHMIFESNTAKRMLKALKWIAIGIPALLLAIYVVMLAINWNDESPSPAALEMAELVESRPVVPDSENGYVYYTGLCAAGQEEDPAKVGAERIARINAVLAKPGVWLDAELWSPSCDVARIRNKEISSLLKACGDFDGLCYDSLLDNEQVINE